MKTKHDVVRDDKYRKALLQLGLSLSKSFDPDHQVHLSLSEFLTILNAERAFLFLTDEVTDTIALKFAIPAQNTEPDMALATKVLADNKPMIRISEKEGQAILAAPLSKHNNLIGVIYFDCPLATSTFSSEDLDILAALANHIAVILETSRAAEVKLLQKTLESDLKLAGIAQSLLLPKADTFDNGPIYGAAFYRSASQTGGDWWHYNANSLGFHFVVADVTGHGAGSAMVSAAAIGVYQTLMNTAHHLSRFQKLEKMNTQFRELVRDQYAMTLFSLEISLDGSEMKGWSAAAPPIFIMDDEGKIEMLAKTSSALGSDDFTMGQFERPLKSKDRIFIFTDGILEFTPVSKTSWSERTLKKLFLDTRPMGVVECRDHIAKTLIELQGGKAPDDDMTFVVIEVK